MALNHIRLWLHGCAFRHTDTHTHTPGLVLAVALIRCDQFTLSLLSRCVNTKMQRHKFLFLIFFFLCNFMQQLQGVLQLLSPSAPLGPVLTGTKQRSGKVTVHFIQHNNFPDWESEISYLYWSLLGLGLGLGSFFLLALLFLAKTTQSCVSLYKQPFVF